MTARSNGIKMLRIEQVEEKVGYKKSTIFEWLRPSSTRYKPHFPIPRKNGRSNRWFESEIDDFCIIEFGCVDSHQRTDSAMITTTHADVTGAKTPTQSSASEIRAKLTCSPGKLEQAQTNRPRKPTPIEEDGEVINIRAAETSAGKNVAAHSTAQLLAPADMSVGTQVQRMLESDENDVIESATELTTALRAVEPAPMVDSRATVGSADPTHKKRVITVSVKKMRTFVSKS